MTPPNPFEGMQRAIAGTDAIYQAQRETGRRMRAAAEAQIILPHLLSGEATFIAMKRAVDDLVSRAPQDHDIFILMDDFSVLEARFIEPHTFLFEGFDQDGHRAGMVCHFSQIKVRVIYRPKRDETRIVSRVIHGFNPNAPSA
jgi:hypothetical protein